MKKLYFFLILFVLTLFVGFTNLIAQTNPGKIPFQGVLYEAGEPVTDTKDMTFSIDALSWSETQAVSIVNGLYSVVLGGDPNNPFPENLFATQGPTDLRVTVGAVDIATVEIHAPYISKEIVKMNMPGQIDGVFTEDAPEQSTLVITASGTATGQNSALEAVSETSDRNTGVEGFAKSADGNTARQTGLYGQSEGTGSGDHRGVVGVGLGGTGKYNKGVYGYADGTGNGDSGQGFGVGSINFGVEGNATGNAWNNTGVEGSNFGDAGEWNFGVHGISNAGTGTDVENHGVAGRAYGSGINYGVFGEANGGAENWAGYFNGDVKITGSLDVSDGFSGTVTADELEAVRPGQEQYKLYVGLGSSLQGGVISFEDGSQNSDGSPERPLVIFSNDLEDQSGNLIGSEGRINLRNTAPDDGRSASLSSGGVFFDGEDTEANIGLFSNFLDGGDEANNRGALYLWGDIATRELLNGQDIRRVSLRVADDGSGGDVGRLTMRGAFEGDNRLVELGGHRNGDFHYGSLTLRDSDGGEFTIDAGGINTSTYTVRNPNGEVKGELNYFAPNDAGSVVLYGQNNERNVIVGSASGGNSGFFGLYDPNSNISVQARSSDDGTGNIYTYGNNNFRTTQLGGFSGQGFFKIEEPNDDGSDHHHSVAAGFWSGRPELVLEKAMGEQRVNIHVANDPDGQDPDGFSGGITLIGSTSSNIEMGGKNWENNGSDLPYFRMNGSYTVDDGNGPYHPDLVWMDIYQDTNTMTEGASLTLRNSDGAEFGINANGFTGELNAHNTIRSIDYSGLGTWDSSAPNPNTPNPPAIDGDWNVLIGPNYYNTPGDAKSNGSVAVFGKRDVSGDEGRTALLSAVGDANDNLYGYFELNGSSGHRNVEFGAKDWEDNGNNLPYMKLTGSGPDDMMWMEVGQDTNTGAEWGAINFHDNSGSYAGMDGTGSMFTSDNLRVGDFFGGNGAWIEGAGNASFTGNLTMSSTEIGNDPYNDGIVLNNGAPNIQVHSGGVEKIRMEGDNGQIIIDSDGGSNSQRMSIGEGGISAGTNSFSDGYNINYDSGSGALLEMSDAGSLNIYMEGRSGNINISGNLSQSSDRRLKKEIKVLDNSLKNVQKLRGVSYNWKDESKSQDKQIGLIAQELEEIYPEFVHTDKDGMKSVNYAQLTAVLIEAVKELTTKVTTLETEKSDLKASLERLSNLESKINLLEKILINKPVDGSKKTASK